MIPPTHLVAALDFPSWLAASTKLELGDLPVVGLYLLILALLSIFGFHRYQLLYLYRKHRDGVTAAPVVRFAALPRVTVQLPIYNERFVVAELIEAVCRLDYPRELLQIQVLDDSTDDTVEVARAAVEHWAGLGYPIDYLHRPHRQGYKAGALAEGLKSARGEFIAIFDADFSPHADFLHRTIHHFSDPAVGMVQARWSYRNRGQSLLTQVQAMFLDGHFVFEHGARARSGRFFNFNGTAGVLRRTMIEDAGGWQHDTLTEDTDLSYRAQMRGWKFIYRPDIEVPSELPTEMASFHAQQARWAKGLIQTAKKLLPRLLRCDLPLATKIEGAYHLGANISFPLMLLLTAIMLPAVSARFSENDPRLLWIDLPLFFATFSSISGFYALAQKELFPQNWKQRIPLVPLLLAVGIGLTFSNTKAVIEALLGIASPFQRTAKYASGRGSDSALRKRYRARAGVFPFANLAAGLYFAAAAIYSIEIGNWPSLPFLTLFAFGFGYTGIVGLWQAFEHRRPAVGGLGMGDESIASSAGRIA